MQKQYNDSLTKVDKLDQDIRSQIEQLDRYKTQVAEELNVLVGFKESINDNQSKIDQALHEVSKSKQMFEDFKSDNMFQHSQNNYAKVYQELSEQRNMIEFDFKPEIAAVRIDKTLFVKHQALEKVQKELQQNKYGLEKSNKVIAKITEEA